MSLRRVRLRRTMKQSAWIASCQLSLISMLEEAGTALASSNKKLLRKASAQKTLAMTLGGSFPTLSI